jgi:alginate O-acetyltransferase complex protein AlgI
MLLLVVSYLFYGSWDYRFLFLILISTVIDFIGGLGVAGIDVSRRRQQALALLILAASVLLCSNIQYGRLLAGLTGGDLAAALAALPHHLHDFLVPLATIAVVFGYGLALPRLYALPEDRRRKTFLTVSMVANLAILGFFKYCDFFITSFQGLIHTLGLPEVSAHTLGIILPAGISFYTFQAMSYTIDIYRGEAKPTESFRDFALFVCFFPHLVAGPIMRAHTLLPQVVNPRKRKPGDMEEGLLLVLIGLFKKIVIADNMAPIANAVFYRFTDGHAPALSGSEVLVGLYAFAFQIYGDFSGYSSIARGISKWLGFELVINFRMPYLAVSPSDFWRRWHISLSTWLRDYLYIPLGGSRLGSLLTYRNLMITMVLGGLWHGANWTFVAWGVFHGAILCIFKLLNVSDSFDMTSIAGRLKWLARVVFMFHLTCLGWLLFRADSFGTVTQMLKVLVTNPHITGQAIAAFGLIAFHCGLLFLIEWALDGEKRLDRLFKASWVTQGAAVGYLLLMMFIFHAGSAYEFIYFQF